MKKPPFHLAALLLTLMAVELPLTGCSTARSFFAVKDPNEANGPIRNPFGDYDPGKGDATQNLVLRTRKGDRAVEVELPAGSAQMTDLVIPVAPAFNETSSGRSPASVVDDGTDTYQAQAPTMADREITRAFPQASAENEATRRDIEQGLGLVPTQDSTPEAAQSYLGAIDHLKSLYKAGRYEAALVETDSLIRQYPTAPKLYQMRGTLLDRVGQTDLAIKNWKQALQFDPSNATLQKFVDRRSRAMEGREREASQAEKRSPASK